MSVGKYNWGMGSFHFRWHPEYGRDSCIVCDNDHIDGDSLLQRKQERRKRIYDSLDVKTKALLKDVAMDSKLGVSDPFEIKNTVLAFISYEELEPITSLREAILSCVNEIVDEMIVALFNVFIPTSMYSWWDEYSTLLEAQPTLDSEELLYIQEIISENIGRNIRITRDPLLADTLIQTLIYYHTRMKVESELVNIFNIPHTEGQVLLLADIIQKAFRPAVGATQEQKDKARNNRVFFTSRKTLLNEFNHFEGNMNIFQPAIDITEAALQKEVADIESKLMQLRAEMR